MGKSIHKPTLLFWAIGVIALLWNAMGIFAYLKQAYTTVDELALMTEPEQLYFNNLPPWVMGAFAIAVFAGFIGCVFLLLRKKIASILFVLSLIAVIGQFVYNFLIQKEMPISGENAIMPIVIVFISIGLVWFAKYSTKRNWIA